MYLISDNEYSFKLVFSLKQMCTKNQFRFPLFNLFNVFLPVASVLIHSSCETVNLIDNTGNGRSDKDCNKKYENNDIFHLI